MKFSVKYIPTSLFSLKDSNSTNSGAKSLLLPSPYSIKMAILNQAITIGGDIDALSQRNSKEFKYIRDARIGIYIEDGSCFSVNNSFVKILKPSRSGSGYQQTVAFREYIHISSPIEIIFEAVDNNAAHYLKQYLHRINYFGKKGSFFQFVAYCDDPNEPNVEYFNMKNIQPGIIQEFEDFGEKSTFDNANNFSSKKSIREKFLMVLPLTKVGASKSYTVYSSN